jgi:hypothetical protein
MPARRLANAVFGHALLGDATLGAGNIDSHLRILLILGEGAKKSREVCVRALDWMTMDILLTTGLAWVNFPGILPWYASPASNCV